MDERVELAITVGATGVLTLAGQAVGGLVGAEMAGVLPVVVQHLVERRRHNVLGVAEAAVEQAEISGPELVDWVKEDDRHAAFLQEALEAAWGTLDADMLSTFARILAEGLGEDDRIELAQLVLRALRDFEPAHIVVLRAMEQRAPLVRWASPEASPWVPPWTIRDLNFELPHLRQGMDALVADLSSHGCIRASDFAVTSELTTQELYREDQVYLLTDFGGFCLRMIKGQDLPSSINGRWEHWLKTRETS